MRSCQVFKATFADFMEELTPFTWENTLRFEYSTPQCTAQRIQRKNFAEALHAPEPIH